MTRRRYTHPTIEAPASERRFFFTDPDGVSKEISLGEVESLIYETVRKNARKEKPRSP